jgi:hypothetical protein
MKSVFATIALGLAFLLPSPALANVNNQCNYLTTQVEHYGGQYKRAKDMGNEVWEERIGAHLKNLTEQRAAMCPEYAKDDRVQRMMLALLKLGAQAAIAYFTGGFF